MIASACNNFRWVCARNNHYRRRHFLVNKVIISVSGSHVPGLACTFLPLHFRGKTRKDDRMRQRRPLTSLLSWGSLRFVESHIFELHSPPLTAWHRVQLEVAIACTHRLPMIDRNFNKKRLSRQQCILRGAVTRLLKAVTDLLDAASTHLHNVHKCSCSLTLTHTASVLTLSKQARNLRLRY